MGLSIRVLTLVFLFVSSHASAALTLDLQLVTGNVSNPVFVTNAGDDSGRLFIVEPAGRIKIFDGATLLSPPFLDISAQVLDNFEQGLLSMAFDPGYKTNGFFYAFFTARDSTNVVNNTFYATNVVARFRASPPGANTVDTNTMQIILRIPHPDDDTNNPAGAHNAGQMQFGPDGFLYISTGDGGPQTGCDPHNYAQNLGSLLGKMLRINVSNPLTNYTIPPGNPFIATNGALPEIWAYGLRNPWRFSFDRLAGDLFIADAGQESRDELDLQLATSAGGENYGWRLYEGTATNTCSVTFSNIASVSPIVEYTHLPSVLQVIVGGYRYRGHAIPPLFGTYVFCDHYNRIPITGANTNASGVWETNVLLNASFQYISSFGEDQAGELYVCRYSTPPGGVYRLVWRDTDSDGLPDDWEQQFFGSPTNADASADADGDGFTNLQEFLAGTDPTNATSALRIDSITILGGGAQIGFRSASNKLYRVEKTEDLMPNAWTILTNNISGTGNPLEIVDPAPNGERQFYRVRLLP